MSVIVVTFNSDQEVGRCIKELEHTHVSIETIVVDNASTDGTVERLKGLELVVPNLRAIYNLQNAGLARANNQGATLAQGKYILILNPDAVAHDEAISRLCSYLDENPSAGVVGPRILSSDGRVEHSYFRNYNLLLDVFANTDSFLDAYAKVISDSLRSRTWQIELSKPTVVDFVSGACMMIRRSLFDAVEGYDENFFLDLRDVADLCIRVRQRGFQVIYLPSATVEHSAGASHLGYKGTFWRFQGCVYYARKHFGMGYSLLVRLGFVIQFTLLVAANTAILAWLSLRRNFSERNDDKITNLTNRVRAQRFGLQKALTRQVHSLDYDGILLSKAWERTD